MFRIRCVYLLLAFGLGGAALLGQGSVAAQTVRPNIIFLLSDDQRWDTLGSYGNSIVRTPNLDRLANQSTVFDNMFVTTSICAPNRASILSGQYVSRHGIWNFGSELSADLLDRSYLGVLKEAGYRLGFIGKWGVGTPPSGLFDYDRAFAGQGKYRIEVEGKARHLTSVMGDQAMAFLDASSANVPFCLSVSFKAAHVQDSYNLSEDPFPFDPDLEHLYANVTIPPPPTARARYYNRLPDFLKNSEARMRWAIRFWGPDRYQDSVKGYYRLISGIDVVVGRILRKLRAKGLAENTVVIFTGDNGFYLGEYGLAGKWFPHEVSIRVPLIIYDPRLPRRQGVRRDELALSIDIAPTIVELAGGEVPAGVQGSSLLPLLDGDDTGWRQEFFYEHLFEHPRIPPTEAVRTEQWKYIRYLGTDPLYEELYDLDNDPLEERNLISAPRYDEQAQAMRRKWSLWRERIR